MMVKNKRGAAEGLSWSFGLIVIFIIVVFFIGIYSISGLDKKTVASVALNGGVSDFYDALTSQRAVAALFTNDFLSDSRGELLKKIYSSFRGTMAFEEPVLAFVKYISYDYYSLVIDNSNVVYGSRKGVDISKCNGQVENGTIYVSSGENEYSSVALIVRECKDD